jgi:sugar (pentulose or hexulose) kinase
VRHAHQAIQVDYSGARGAPYKKRRLMSASYILSIDNGTQSVRAIVFDLQGNIVAKTQVHLEAYFSDQPGWAEHDPEDYWQAVCTACQRLWAQNVIAPEDIKGVAVTTQRGTMINLDKNGKPLRPAITWLDQRRTDVVPPISLFWKLAFKLAGVAQTINYFRGEAETNWIKVNQPEIWDKTDKYVMLSGYLNYRLCGKFIDSIGSQVGYLPFDYKRLKWAGRRDWKWQALAIKAETLPELVAPGSLMGNIDAAAALATGIPEGTPLMAAAADKACEVIGAGCVQPHIGCLSYGTTATINTTSAKYLEVTPFIPPYPAAIPGSYSTEVQIFRGYWMVNWFKEQFGHHEKRQAAEQGIAAEALFDELVNAVPPGSMGLMLQPYWSPGIKVPGPEAKGAIIGFGDVHTRAHMYRAILEGLAYALREGKEKIEKRSGVAITELRISGGGSQSDAAMQLTADIFGLPTSRPHVYETSGLGAAIDAAVGLGLYPDFATAIKAMTRIGKTFYPIEKNQNTYDALYRQVYQKMYTRLQPLYLDIQKITGYPKLN